MFLPLLLSAVVATSSAQAKTVIHWSVAHDPGNTRVLAAIQHFGEEIKAQTKGELELQIDQFTHGEANLFRQAADNVESGDVQMSQIGTFMLARYANELNVIDVPFLFRDHAHAAKVLDGPVGKQLMDALYEGSNHKVRAFGFTYSGGYRQIYGTREIRKVEDFAGQKMFKPGESLGREFLGDLGVKFIGDTSVSQKKDVVAAFRQGTIDQEEGEYNRLGTIQKMFGDAGKVPVVNETNHSLFLTMIVVNEKFFQSLSKEHREIVTKAAHQMLLAEREISIQQEAGNKAVLESSGVRIVRMAAAERARFVDAAKAVLERNKDRLGKLVDAIRATK